MADPLAPGQTVWGVDLGLSLVTFCAVRPAADPVWRQAHGINDAKVPIAERLSVLGHEVRATAHALAEDSLPACVMVEQPIAAGKTNAGLLWACGVVTVALYEALAGHNPIPTPIWHMNVSQWKKRAVGKGNADKPAVHAWATELTGADLTYDEADALGIATATLEQLEVVGG